MKFTYDAVSGLAFLVNQLAHIEKKMFAVQYQDITYTDLIPISMEAGEYATAVDYYYMDGKAIAEFVGTKSLNVPIAEIGAEKVTIGVERAAIGYEYSDEELRQAMHVGIPLPQQKANTARRGMEELFQATSMTGNASKGLPGFINNVNVTAATVVNPGAGTEFINKTPAQILFDINDFMGDVFVDTLQAERVTDLLLPTAQWNYIANTYRADGSDRTILQALAANSPYLKSADNVKPVAELAGAGAGGTDRMMCYTKTTDKVVLHIPMPIKFTAAERRGLGFQVPGEAKIAGVEFRYPGSARYADGI